ncbi:MAG TPA: hypothetical protein VN915_15480 [Elusimicrobiota bacterium]|nr:hypothetical protein [Elusimicrobiota bacterium]
MIASLLLAASLAAVPASAASSIHLTPEQAHAIGLKIWRNEAGGKVQFLTHWNKGEEFGSFGIGHFIWYPEGERGPFTESFPGVVDALTAAGESVPSWLRGACPWKDRAAFYADFDGERLTELRALLARTVDVQALYAAHRLENALPKVLAAAEPAERAALEKRFNAVAAAPNGVYALVDYVNFKGEGTNPTERYAGEGWGLLQVLELMDDAAPGQASVEAFEKGADAALTRRVADAPAERRAVEQGWLPGWRVRLKTYLEP